VDFGIQKNANKPKTRPSAQASTEIKQLTDFIRGSELGKIEKDETVKKLNAIDTFVQKQDEESKKEADKSTTRIEMYRNLSSLGISSLAFHHEIRQHIGRISQWLRLLLSEWKDLDDAEKLEYIEDSREDVVTIIDLNKYIREFAALFSGLKGTRKRREEINLLDSVNNFKKGFSKILANNGVEIVPILGPGRFSGLYMNRASWESVMLNLISNSIKALGNVERQRKIIQINFEKTDVNLKIQVYDNGMGIEEENYERIFDPLWTTYKSIEDPGTGMGMTIVKEIIEDDYGGAVSVKSSKYDKAYPGNGETTIQILIPLEKLKGA